MDKKKLLTYSLIAAGVLVFLTCAYLFMFCRGVKVKVVSGSTGVLDNIEIKYTGGSHRGRSMRNGESYSFRIKPTGQSNLEATWNERGGRKYFKSIDVQLDKGGRGKITIKIEPGGKVTIKDSSKPPLF